MGEHKKSHMTNETDVQASGSKQVHPGGEKDLDILQDIRREVKMLTWPTETVGPTGRVV